MTSVQSAKQSHVACPKGPPPSGRDVGSGGTRKDLELEPVLKGLSCFLLKEG